MTTDTGELYFDLEGRPARTVNGGVPLVTQPNGTETRDYALERFYNSAQRITRAQYDALKAEDRSPRG